MKDLKVNFWWWTERAKTENISSSLVLHVASLGPHCMKMARHTRGALAHLGPSLIKC